MRGLNDAAAVGIVEKMMSFLFLVPSSMLSAVSVSFLRIQLSDQASRSP